MRLFRKRRVPESGGIPGSGDFLVVEDGSKFIGWTFAWNGRFSWMDSAGEYMTDDTQPGAELDASCGTSATRDEAERKLRFHTGTEG